MRVLLLAAGMIALVLAGCSGSDRNAAGASTDSDGDGISDVVERHFKTDPRDNTSVPDVWKQQDVSFTQTVQTIGTGVPGVQCPADPINSQTLTWTVTADTGQANRTELIELVVDVAGAVTVNDVDVFLSDPNGNLIGSGTGGSNHEVLDLAGPRPLGDYRIEIRGCSGAGDVTVTGTGIVKWLPSDEELLAT